MGSIIRSHKPKTLFKPKIQMFSPGNTVELVLKVNEGVDRMNNMKNPEISPSETLPITDRGPMPLKKFHSQPKLERNNGLLQFNYQLSDCFKFLHMPRQQSCRGMCKNFWQSCCYNLDNEIKEEKISKLNHVWKSFIINDLWFSSWWADYFDFGSGTTIVSINLILLP